MEAEEIHTNQEVKMQAAAYKDRRPGVSTIKDAAGDPNYENITLTFRKQDKPKGGHASPKNQVPAMSRSHPDGALGSPWLHRTILSLYAFLALTFILCIIFSALVLAKNTELSGQLRGLQRQLYNVSSALQDFQTRQKQDCGSILTLLKPAISKVEGSLKSGNEKLDKLKTLPTDMNMVKTKLQTISNWLQQAHPTHKFINEDI